MPAVLLGHSTHVNTLPAQEHWQRPHIDSQRTWVNGRMSRGTGPKPVFRPFAKTPANRIVVNIVNLLIDRLRLEHVAVVTAAALPEPIVRPAVWLPIFHPGQKTQRLAPHTRLVGQRSRDCWPAATEDLPSGRPNPVVVPGSEAAVTHALFPWCPGSPWASRVFAALPRTTHSRARTAPVRIRFIGLTK